MGMHDAFRKSKEGGKTHSTPPPVGHTLVEIRDDPHKSHLFGQLLEREGKHELAQRMAEGKLEEDDIVFLEEQRKLLSEKIVGAEKIEKLLTPDRIIELARNNPHFEQVINLLGPEKAAKVIQAELAEMSITDESRFERISKGVLDLESYKSGEYKRIEEEVEKLCKDNNIKPQEYTDALAISDPDEKEAKLKELSKRTYTGFEAAVNKLSFGWLAKNTLLEKLKDSEAPLEDSMKELDSHNRHIGLLLYVSMNSNENLRAALSAELASEKPKTERKLSFKDAKKEAEGKMINDEELEKAWKAYKRSAHYDREDAAGQNIIKDLFIKEQKQKHGEKNPKSKGFWADIFGVLFEKKIEDKKSSLK